MKLTVDTLDNEVKSAVINIGKDNGYIEAFIDEMHINPELHIYVYNSHGDVFSREVIPLGLLNKRRATGGWTAPKFEPALDAQKRDALDDKAYMKTLESKEAS